MGTGLNIAALAQRTGVAADTLRKWEQRYSILQPTRTAGGQRRYSERDVVRVEWLSARLAEGYRIGEAAALLGTVDDAPAPARSPGEHLRGMLGALDAGSLDQIGLRLDQSFALLGVDATLESVLEPLLRSVGDRWADGALSVAEEHVVSEAVRSRLGHLIGDAGGGVLGVAVLACAPGEQHELGLMMAAIVLRRDGWQVAYLGADTPVPDAVALAVRLSARVLGISVTRAEHTAALEDGLAAATLPDGLALVLGGRAATPALAQSLHALRVDGDLAGTVTAVRALAA